MQGLRKKFDWELKLDFYKLNDKETDKVTNLLVKNLSNNLMIGNRRRIKSLHEKAKAQ